ncbi:3938_t:CDS:2, partial [Racocetra persica]
KTDVGIVGSSPNTTNKRLWVAFGQWLGLKRQDATAFNTQRKKARLIISACHNPQSISKLVQFKYIAEPEYITDLSGQTLVYLEQLDDYNAIILATNAVNNYYFHTLEHPSHRSDEFWTNFIEHFRAYTRNNLLSFTSSNTASTHNIDYYECINKLLQGLKALSDYINAINFNTTSDYHWDEHDEANSLYVLVALGDYDGGELSYIKAGIKKDANRLIVSEQDLNNAQGLNHRTHLPKPKAKPIQVPSAVSDRRQGYIDLARV